MIPQPAMVNIDERLRIMDRNPGYIQILNISLPPPEEVTSPEDTVELCEIANDAMAELSTGILTALSPQWLVCR